MSVSDSIKTVRTLKPRLMGRKFRLNGEIRTVCDVSFDKRGVIVYLTGGGRTTWIHANELKI